MTRRRRGDGQRAAILAHQFRGRPRHQALHMSPQPLRARDRRQHAARLGQKVASRMIEIVRVLVMAEQHGIDVTDGVGAERGAGQFLEFDMRQLIGARRIEGRIGEKPKSVDFNQRGGTADQGNAKGTHIDLAFLVPRFLIAVLGRDGSPDRCRPPPGQSPANRGTRHARRAPSRRTACPRAASGSDRRSRRSRHRP